MRRPHATVEGELLDSHALGEIARFVDVAAEFDGEMIGEKLEAG